MTQYDVRATAEHRDGNMSGELIEIAGTHLHVCAPDGPVLRKEADANDLLGESYGSGAEWIVIPTSRLDDDFFRLSTRLAGAILQKLVNYQCRVVILGDISHHLISSGALRDFVREANRGRQVWFVCDMDELAERLAA
jgi:hypothetical protein